MCACKGVTDFLSLVFTLNWCHSFTPLNSAGTHGLTEPIPAGNMHFYEVSEHLYETEKLLLLLPLFKNILMSMLPGHWVPEWQKKIKA